MHTPLYLIDGSSCLYRACFAIKRLSSPTGFPTNALYGFTQMLLKLLKDHLPQHLAMVFDAGRVTFRSDLTSLLRLCFDKLVLRSQPLGNV